MIYKSSTHIFVIVKRMFALGVPAVSVRFVRRNVVMHHKVGMVRYANAMPVTLLLLSRSSSRETRPYDLWTKKKFLFEKSGEKSGTEYAMTVNIFVSLLSTRYNYEIATHLAPNLVRDIFACLCGTIAYITSSFLSTLYVSCSKLFKGFC